MSDTETLQRPGVIELPDETVPQNDGLGEPSTGSAPPIYGRCPVCGKPLFPRDKITGQVKAPSGSGIDNRAKCGGCGTVLYYLGNGNWRILTDSDITDDDRFADKLGI